MSRRTPREPSAPGGLKIFLVLGLRYFNMRPPCQGMGAGNRCGLSPGACLLRIGRFAGIVWRPRSGA